MIIKRKSSESFDYTFLLVSLYLFLIIFFLLLTSGSKLVISQSFKVKNSLEEKFNPNQPSKKPFLDVNNFYKTWYLQAKSQLELDLRNYSDVEIISSKQNIFFKFALPIDSFFSHNEIDINKKILLSKLSNLLNQKFKSDPLRLEIILASDNLASDKTRFISILNYVSKLNNNSIDIGFRSSFKNDNKIYFTFAK